GTELLAVRVDLERSEPRRAVKIVGMASKILVVEDDQDIRQLLHLQLSAAGFETAFARDAATALAVVRKERPNLILLDIGLPAGDGFVVMERMRAIPDLEMLPVIVITARGALEGEKAVALGARSYFQKPFDAGALVAEIRRTLGG
ncbi:MAG: response regulator, partial [Actinomycetota bacterium]|nr:response regulator [Actinomycetota bacterium]